MESTLLVSFDEAERLLLLEGDIDDQTIGVFDDELQKLATSGGGVVEVSKVGFFPSMAIAALVRSRRLAVEHGSVIDTRAEPGTIAHRVLVITGLQVS